MADSDSSAEDYDLLGTSGASREFSNEAKEKKENAQDENNYEFDHSEDAESENQDDSINGLSDSESDDDESVDPDQWIKNKLIDVLSDVRMNIYENATTSTMPIAQPSFATILEVDQTTCMRGQIIAQPLTFNPGLQIAGYEGTVGLPLQAKDAGAIADLAHQSPFGKGEQTVIDTSVRNSIELNSDQFSFCNPFWPTYLENFIIPKALQGLGFDRHEPTENVVAEQYKLLLYEEGAFFRPHRDSEKAPGKFATLVVSLPSEHLGGEVVLKHKNQTLEFATGGKGKEWEGPKFAAWFADVQHEVKPVTEGRRLVATYNLIRKPKDLTNSLHSNPGQLLTQLKSTLRYWTKQSLPKALAYQLSHQYTAASLSFDGLEGDDRAQVRLLRQACFEEGFQVCLAILQRTVERDAYDAYDNEDGSDCEGDDLSLSAIVCNFDGQNTDKQIASHLNFDKDWLMQDDIYRSRDPDSESDEEYTGNEAVTGTHRYRDTVAFVVPNHQFFTIFTGFRLCHGFDKVQWLRYLQGRLPASNKERQYSSQQDLANCTYMMQLCSAIIDEHLSSGGRTSYYPTVGQNIDQLLVVIDALRQILQLDKATDGTHSLRSSATELAMRLTEALVQKDQQRAYSEIAQLVGDFGFKTLGEKAAEKMFDLARSTAAGWNALQELCGSITTANPTDLEAFEAWFTDKLEALIVYGEPRFPEDGRALVDIVLSESKFKHAMYGKSGLSPTTGGPDALKTPSGLHDIVYALLQRSSSGTWVVIAFLKELGGRLSQDATQDDDPPNTDRLLFSNVLRSWCQKLHAGETKPLPDDEDLLALTKLCLQHDSEGLGILWSSVTYHLSSTRSSELQGTLFSYIKKVFSLALTDTRLDHALCTDAGRSLCLATLNAFIRNTTDSRPTKPTTWARDVPVGMRTCINGEGYKPKWARDAYACRSGCSEVAEFIRSKNVQVKQFKMQQTERTHVIKKLENTAFDMEIIRSVKPHQLKVSKTTKEYDSEFDAWKTRMASGQALVSQVRDLNEPLLRRVLGEQYEDILAFKRSPAGALTERDANTLPRSSIAPQLTGKKRKRRGMVRRSESRRSQPSSISLETRRREPTGSFRERKEVSGFLLGNERAALTGRDCLLC